MIISQPSQAAEVLAGERRRGPRHPALNQVAKIRLANGREELCLIRDISAEGLKAEIYIAIEAGSQIDVELRTAHVVRGRIAWAAGKEIGIAFCEPIPAAAMLAHCSFEARVGNPRPPRLRVNLRGLLRIGATARMVSIGNVSQAGMQIEAPQPLRPGANCSVALPGLPARAAEICWWRDGSAGLMLTEPFDYPTFARWRAGQRAFPA